MVLTFVVVACFGIGGCVMVAALMHARRQPLTELRKTVATPTSLCRGDVQKVLERSGWQVLDRDSVAGEIAYETADLGLALSTLVGAPQGGDDAASLLFIHRRTARSAPCLLRICLREALKGGVAEVWMRGWGDGFIQAWIYRRRFQSALLEITR